MSNNIGFDDPEEIPRWRLRAAYRMLQPGMRLFPPGQKLEQGQKRGI